MSEQLRQGDPDQTSDAEGLHGESGTLDQGYGQSEPMGEEQWSQERYEQGAKQVDAKVLDNLPEGERVDVDRMAGGMFTPDDTTGDEASAGADTAETNLSGDANEQMPGAW